MSMTANRNTTNNNKTEQQYHHQPEDHNNYYYIAHGAGRVISAEVGERIKEAYMDNISDRMTGAVANMITAAFEKGLSAEEIIMAIEETGFAPHPSPAYLRRILESWAEFGVTVSKIKHTSHINKAIPWWK